MSNTNATTSTGLSEHEQLVERVWRDASAPLLYGAREMAILMPVVYLIGYSGMEEIGRRFSALTGAPAHIVFDPLANVMRVLLPPCTEPPVNGPPVFFWTECLPGPSPDGELWFSGDDGPLDPPGPPGPPGPGPSVSAKGFANSNFAPDPSEPPQKPPKDFGPGFGKGNAPNGSQPPNQSHYNAFTGFESSNWFCSANHRYMHEPAQPAALPFAGSCSSTGSPPQFVGVSPQSNATSPSLSIKDITVGGMHDPMMQNTSGNGTNRDSNGRSKIAKERLNKVPRPPNAFILYRQQHHQLVKDSMPGITNNKISEIIGANWNNESEDTKAKFKKMAQDIKLKHFEQHPEYQYQPRKPKERKRRMTKLKIARVGEAVHDLSNGVSTQTSPSTVGSPDAHSIHYHSPSDNALSCNVTTGCDSNFVGGFQENATTHSGFHTTSNTIPAGFDVTLNGEDSSVYKLNEDLFSPRLITSSQPEAPEFLSQDCSDENSSFIDLKLNDNILDFSELFGEFPVNP